jgi:membrane-associated protein
MFGWLVEVATSEWVYLGAGGVVLVDGLIGLIPSETVLHGAGVGASRGSTSVVLLIAIATVSAIVADLLAYAVGARWGTTLRDKFLRSDRIWSSEKSERRVRGVRAQLDERPWILAVARFVPALRTVTMYSAGTLEFPRHRFLLHEVPGAFLWASFHVSIGYVLGRVYEDTSFWVPFAVAAGIAGALAAVFEVVRRTKLKLEDQGDDGGDE